MLKVFIFVFYAILSSSAMSLRNEFNVSFEVSQIPEREIRKIFSELENDPRLPHKVVQSGCSERAIKMCDILRESYQIYCGRVFALGSFRVATPYTYEGFVDWHNFHTALFILNENNQPRIIDPSLFDRPVHLETWVKKLTTSQRSKLRQIFYAEAFTYSPEGAKYSAHNLTSNERAQIQQVLDENLEIQSRHPLLK